MARGSATPHPELPHSPTPSHRHCWPCSPRQPPHRAWPGYSVVIPNGIGSPRHDTWDCQTQTRHMGLPGRTANQLTPLAPAQCRHTWSGRYIPRNSSRLEFQPESIQAVFLPEHGFHAQPWNSRPHVFLFIIYSASDE